MVAAAVGYGESEGYTDAVGDIELARLGPYATEDALKADYAARVAAGKPVPSPKESVNLQEVDGWYVVNLKWGPSVGWFQIRALDDPNAWGVEDRVRIASGLRDPEHNAYAAFVISRHGTDWTKWSVYRSGRYKDFLNVDYELKTGHPRAGEWNV